MKVQTVYRWQVILLSVAVFLGGCASQGVVGQGEYSEVTHDISGVTALEAHETGTVTVVSSDRNELVVRAQSNVHDVLEVTVDGENLVIDLRPGRSISSRTRIDYMVYRRDLSEIDLRGAFTLKGDGLRSPELALKLSGSVSTTLSGLAVDELVVNTSGSSDLTFAGERRDVSLTSSGSLSLMAGSLSTETFRLRSSGSASAEVRVADQLNVNSSGSARIRYFG